MRVLFFMFISLNMFSCPKIKSILIDACGTNEERNEWLVLTTDISISINSLVIDYDPSNNIGGSVNADIVSGGCSWITPRTSSMDSLKINTINNSNFIPISPGGTIPANSTILVLTSDSLNYSYDLSNLTYYGNVYVVQSSCKRNSGAFTNLGNGANYRITKIRYNSCRDSVRHYIGNSALNGQYGIRTRDTMRVSYGNILLSSCNMYLILPIELSSFEVNCDFITFTTESELNVKKFNIQVSNDAINWITLEDIIPRNLSNTTTIYNFPNPNLGNYYRLKETDFENTYYFDIYYKKCENPSNEYIIYDMLGKIVTFPLQNGVYIKKYKNKSEKIIVY
jgi:hypothetical protein